MPNPKDPEKLAAYREKMRQIALSKGYGKWMKGKKLTEEEKKHRSEAMKRACSSPEHREKMSRVAKEHGVGKWMKGKKCFGVALANLRRKGLTYKELYGEDRAKEERRKRRVANLLRWVSVERKQKDRHNGDSRYKEWRVSVFERDDYTCQLCGERGGELNAHHIKPWAKFKELRYERSNGVTLCKACHDSLHRSI